MQLKTTRYRVCTTLGKWIGISCYPSKPSTAGTNGRWSLFSVRAAITGLDAARQITNVDGLWEVLAALESEARSATGCARHKSSEEEHRHVLERGIALEPCGQLTAIRRRHHDVHE